MPNGGDTESRVRATLYGAFALRHELSGGKRLPAGGEVHDIDSNLSGSDSEVPEIAFRVVSAAFEGLTVSERFSLVHEALLTGALNGPLYGVYVRATDLSEGEFDVIPPSGTLGVHHKVLIEARTYSEMGEAERSPLTRPHTHQVPIEGPTGTLRAKERGNEPTDRSPSGNGRDSILRRRRNLSSNKQRDRHRFPLVDADDGQTSQLRHHKVLWTAPAVLLVIAVLPLPYAYYTFLRLFVCAASAYLAYQHFVHEDSVDRWVVLLVAIALLYNPFIPIYLTREIWILANLITATTFVLHFALLRRHIGNSDS